MRLNGKEVDLPKLQGELNAAGIEVTALGTYGDDLFTYDDAGQPLDLPGEAEAVVDRHDPTDLVARYAQREQEEALAAVTDADDLQARFNLLQRMTVGVPQ